MFVKEGYSEGPAHLDVYLLSTILRSEKIGLAEGPVLLVCTASALRTSNSSIPVYFLFCISLFEAKNL